MSQFIALFQLILSQSIALFRLILSQSIAMFRLILSQRGTSRLRWVIGEQSMPGASASSRRLFVVQDGGSTSGTASGPHTPGQAALAGGGSSLRSASATAAGSNFESGSGGARPSEAPLAASRPTGSTVSGAGDTEGGNGRCVKAERQPSGSGGAGASDSWRSTPPPAAATAGGARGGAASGERAWPLGGARGL